MRNALRWASLVLLALALATTARSSPFTYAGDFVYGDDVNGLSVILSTSTGRYDLTGTSVAMIARTYAGGRAYDLTITAQLVDPTAGSIVVPDIGAAARNPGRFGKLRYDARLRITSGSGVAYSQPFTFSVSNPLP